MQSFTLRDLRPFVLRASIDEPILTSFGIMNDRPAVLIRAEDSDGMVGWGETWCNFPSCGAEHRARLLETEIAPRLVGRTIDNPSDTFHYLTAELRNLVNQSAEIGPIAQVVAGTDIALWDIASRKAGQPLWKFLGGNSNTVPVYASGINPKNPTRIVRRKLTEGYRAFKVKVGFDNELDRANLVSVKQLIGPDANLMADANQAWNLVEAKNRIESFSDIGLLWIEEPMPVDSPAADWEELSNFSPLQLAGGENIRDEAAFNKIIDSKIFSYIQPDIGKWGGISGCFTVARNAIEAGIIYCPHWLGGGVGLLASAHLLAAVGGAGQLEIDANPNPLRDLFTGYSLTPIDGVLHLDESPGLGRYPDPKMVAKYG